MHEIVTNDWFLLISGLCSIIGVGLSIFAVNKVIKIDNSLKINSQNITATNDSKAAGRDLIDSSNLKGK